MTTCGRLKRAASSALLLAVVALAAVTATPGQGTAQTLSPTPVTVSDFGPVILDGTTKTTNATMSNFSVTDSAGAGWHITVTGTQFAEVDAAGQYVTGGKTLPTGSLTMPAPTVTPTSALVTVTAGPYAIDGTTVKIVSAALTATGTFDVTHNNGPLTLSVPASAYARSYRSDITVAVASGP